MAIIKCKMCGGDLEIIAGSSVMECEYCGTQQTVPNADNEKKLTLFGRANRLRMACEFDKAAGVYESIVAEFPEEAEAYWGLVLCRYGIEYVDDPASGKKIPTCHRSSFDSVMDDSNLEQALENADAVARKIYREEAKAIEELRKGIIEVSGKEEPYDIFICYKETAANGDRTIDSVIAQDVYDALTEKGYRVFFSRITLEDKLGQEYEPYIFAAIHSAKIMLAFGTDYEYYNAVWVKNEWSRFLQLIAAGEKKTLIPCFKGIDAYDMPKEFARLQAQDMGKVGAIQDLLRGIEKILPREKTVVKETVLVQQSGENSKVAALLDRGNMALEDGDWAKADGFFEEVLNHDSKNTWAYIGKTLAQERCKTLDVFVNKRIAVGSESKTETRTIPENRDHIQKMVDQMTLRGYLTSDEIKKLYQYDLSYSVYAPNRHRKLNEAEAYWNSHKLLSRAEQFAQGETAHKLKEAKERLRSALREKVEQAETSDEEVRKALQERYIAHLTAADQKAAQLRAEAEKHREADYQEWAEIARTAQDAANLKQTAFALEGLRGYKDSASLAALCKSRSAELETAEAERKRILREMEAAEAERQRIIREKEAKARAAKKKQIGIIVGLLAVIAVAASVAVTQVVIPSNNYAEAEQLLADARYEEAIAAFELLADYKDSAVRVEEVREAQNAAKYEEAISLRESGAYEVAVQIFTELANYRDSAKQIRATYYAQGQSAENRKDYVSALTAYKLAEDYEDSQEKAESLSLLGAIAEDVVTLGQFELDGNESNGKEAIDWVVLQRDGTKLFLLSKYCIADKVFSETCNSRNDNNTWAESTLRKWLNNGFYTNAFSPEEKNIIQETVSLEKNMLFGKDNVEVTNSDYVFLLDQKEATAFETVIMYGVEDELYSGEELEPWWTRDVRDLYPHEVHTTTAYDIEGTRAAWHSAGVRPAMWVDTNALVGQ